MIRLCEIKSSTYVFVKVVLQTRISGTVFVNFCEGLRAPKFLDPFFGARYMHGIPVDVYTFQFFFLLSLSR